MPFIFILNERAVYFFTYSRVFKIKKGIKGAKG